MQDNTPSRGVFAQATPYVMTIVFAFFSYKASFPLWDWAMPVIHFICDGTYELLIVLGVNANTASQLAPYSDNLIVFLLHFVCGMIIGAFTGSRWRRFTVLFAVVLFTSPYVMAPTELRDFVQVYGWKPLGLWAFFRLLKIVLPAMLGAWIASRPRKRRLQRRRAAGLCEKCGYSLTGNTSNICPECGMSIIQKIKEPLLAQVIRRLKWPDPDPP